jgi:hypothetical protein
MIARRLCASATIALASLSIAASAEARSAVHAGRTSDGSPLVITASGKQLRSITLRWLATCPSGYVIPFAGKVRYAGKPPSLPPTSLTPGRSELYATALSKTGKFSGNVYGELDLGPHYRVDVTGFIAGRLTRTGGSGGYTMLVSVLDASKNTVLERCSAESRWKVARNARTYGGETSQGEPVAITLNAKRTKIADMLVAYRLDCGGSRFLTWSDDFTFLLGRGGHFGARFTDDGTIDGGNGASRKIFYDISGSVMRNTAKGALTVTTREIDAEGNVQPQGCATPELSWTAANG